MMASLKKTLTLTSKNGNGSSDGIRNNYGNFFSDSSSSSEYCKRKKFPNQFQGYNVDNLKSRLSGIVIGWTHNKTGARGRRQFSEVSEPAYMLQRLYEVKDGEKGIGILGLRDSEADTKGRFGKTKNGPAWAKAYLTFAWVIILAMDRGGEHKEMCELMFQVMKKFANMGKTKIKLAAITPLEVWNIFYNLQKSAKNGQTCSCKNVYAQIDRVFPRKMLSIEESSTEPMEYKFFSLKKNRAKIPPPKIHKKVRSTRQNPTPPNKVVKNAEGRANPDGDDSTSSSSESEDSDAFQTSSIVEEHRLKKQRENVFLMPNFRPLSIKEILKGFEINEYGLEKNNGSEEPLQKRMPKNFSKCDGSTDATWPRFVCERINKIVSPKLGKTVGKNQTIYVPSKQLNQSVRRSQRKERQSKDVKVPYRENTKETIKDDNISEELHNFENYEMIVLRNPFCRRNFIDLTSKSLKQGVKKGEQEFQLVFFLAKSKSTEELRKSCEDGVLCKCCPDSSSLFYSI